MIKQLRELEKHILNIELEMEKARIALVVLEQTIIDKQQELQKAIMEIMDNS